MVLDTTQSVNHMIYFIQNMHLTSELQHRGYQEAVSTKNNLLVKVARSSLRPVSLK